MKSKDDYLIYARLVSMSMKRPDFGTLTGDTEKETGRPIIVVHTKNNLPVARCSLRDWISWLNKHPEDYRIDSHVALNHENFPDENCPICKSIYGT